MQLTNTFDEFIPIGLMRTLAVGKIPYSLLFQYPEQLKYGHRSDMIFCSQLILIQAGKEFDQLHRTPKPDNEIAQEKIHKAN